jgi:threonylcarbamoyladenosine tRNA methylthiotransferase MtaB
MTKEVINEIAQLEKVCRHFHLSLQSGCDETLKRMGRKYTTGEYREIVERLKEALPGVAITTDVMVGFPGETREEFEKTYRFLRNLGLYNMHVFKYSPRKGTPAASFAGQVSAKEKDERSRALIDLAARCRKNFHDKFVGQSLDVLYEQWSSLEGYYEGLTDNYIKVLSPTRDDLNNKLIKTMLVESSEDYMKGRV